MAFLILTISALLILIPSFSNAQESPFNNRLKEIKHKFEELTLETRMEFAKLRHEAQEANRNNKPFTCLSTIHDALSIFPHDVELIWLNGICLAEIQDIDAAITMYNKVLKINPYHIPTLVNLIEINFFAGRYKEANKRLLRLEKLNKSRNNPDTSFLDFKRLICITRLSKENPSKYNLELESLSKLYTFMDDTPYFYYANALKSFDTGDHKKGYKWISKAHSIFNNVAMTKAWTKALVDTEFIFAHEIIFNQSKNKEEQQ